MQANMKRRSQDREAKCSNNPIQIPPPTANVDLWLYDDVGRLAPLVNGPSRLISIITAANFCIEASSCMVLQSTKTRRQYSALLHHSNPLHCTAVAVPPVCAVTGFPFHRSVLPCQSFSATEPRSLWHPCSPADRQACMHLRRGETNGECRSAAVALM